ncbi:MAG: SDR family oxidoreductase [Leptospiraceae bacterium]|nr:SDR family oxidoreductase [Leptospiraceae bacterium]MCB1315825.1 SDR family oxidoreductase [Leptospiraceae bacterium]MCB1319916.1 SDR family oxidoreductase [Leptospiraceae bacterium]
MDYRKKKKTDLRALSIQWASPMQTIFRSDIFQDRVIIVTGGGSGIGLRTARELLMLHGTVVIAGRKAEKLQAARDFMLTENPDAHTRLIAHTCNIRNEDEVRNLCARVVSQCGRIDCLVNNAGGQFPSKAEEITLKGWQAVIETNLTGTFLMSREVFRQSMETHGGAIVNVIADISHGFPMMAHTGAARAGVENLTRSLANEWGRAGVRVNSVAPGIIQSSGIDTYEPRFRDFVLSMGRYNQANRLGSEAEVAAAILYLLTPAAAFITGETLKVDGGASIYTPIYPPVEHERNSAFDGQ